MFAFDTLCCGKMDHNSISFIYLPTERSHTAVPHHHNAHLIKSITQLAIYIYIYMNRMNGLPATFCTPNPCYMQFTGFNHPFFSPTSFPQRAECVYVCDHNHTEKRNIYHGEPCMNSRTLLPQLPQTPHIRFPHALFNDRESKQRARENRRHNKQPANNLVTPLFWHCIYLDGIVCICVLLNSRVCVFVYMLCVQ